MPSIPVLLASGELPLFGERLNVDDLRDGLRVPLFGELLAQDADARFPGREMWTHAFLAVVHAPDVDVRAVLRLRHRLDVADLRLAAEQRLATLGTPVGAHRSPERARALHDLTVARADTPADAFRLYLYVKASTGNAVPSISDLPILAGTSRMAVAA